MAITPSPNDSFIFISELSTGSIGDRQLFERSGILKLLDSVPPGKSLMADRGFEIQDLLVSPVCYSTSPPFSFLVITISLAADEVRKTQYIARQVDK